MSWAVVGDSIIFLMGMGFGVFIGALIFAIATLGRWYIDD